jgi:hypothetical protein
MHAATRVLINTNVTGGKEKISPPPLLFSMSLANIKSWTLMQSHMQTADVCQHHHNCRNAAIIHNSRNCPSPATTPAFLASYFNRTRSPRPCNLATRKIICRTRLHNFQSPLPILVLLCSQRLHQRSGHGFMVEINYITSSTSSHQYRYSTNPEPAKTSSLYPALSKENTQPKRPLSNFGSILFHIENRELLASLIITSSWHFWFQLKQRIISVVKKRTCLHTQSQLPARQ